MKSILSTITALAILNLGWSQGDGNTQKEQLHAVTASYEKIYGFSGTLKVVVKDEPIFEKSYGLANRSFNIKNSPDTRFSINSISKTFTAVAVLILAKDNKVDLNTPIKSYLKELKASWSDSVTIHHLLTHTSGLPRESGVQPHHEKTFREQVNLVGQQSLLFSPGERYEYSNAGIILLGAIIERSSGQTYEAFISQNVLQPLGLKNTGYYQGRNVVERLAVPYRLTPNGLEFAQRSKHYGDNAGGGLYSTPTDLYIFLKGLEEYKVLPKKYIDLMFQSHVATGERDAEGYAWSIKYFGEEKIYFAAGSGYGTKSVIIRMPDSGDFVGITSNWGNTPILQLLRDVYLTLKGQSIKLPSTDALADPNAFTDDIGTYIFDKEALTKHLGINQSILKLQEFEGRLFLDDELLAADNDFLKLTYTDELKIHFKNQQMIIEINGNTIIGRKL